MSEIRDYLNAVLKMMPSNRLFEFLAAHGETYPVGPHSFSLPRDEPKQCYANATHLALSDPMMTYVEGKVTCMGLPIEHAWCLDETGTVVDTTLRDGLDGTPVDERVREYYGVTFRTDYLRKAILVNDCYGLLDIFYQRKTLPKLVELGLEAGQQWLLDAPVKRRRGKLLLAGIAAAALLLVAPAAPQAAQSTLYGPDGRAVGHETTGQNGTGTLYGADGRVRERSTTGTDGTVTTYGQDGRVILRAVPQRTR